MKLFGRRSRRSASFKFPKNWMGNIVGVGIIVGLIFFVWFFMFRTAKKELVFTRDLTGQYDFKAHLPLTDMTTGLKTEDEGASIEVRRGDSSLQILQPLAAAQLSAKKGQATYTDSSKNIELRYTLKPTGIKEDIVLKKAPNEHIFASAIKLTNLTAHMNSDGIPIFTDKKGSYQFHFEKPYAIDAKGERTNSVRYHLVPAKDATKAAEIIAAKSKTGTKKLFGIEGGQYADNQYVLMTEVDKEWLQDSKRAYPVTIDPTVVHDTSSEFATGQFDRGKDFGSGSNPSLQTNYGELPVDQYTAGLWHFNELEDDHCNDGKDVCDVSGNSNNGAQSGGVTINTTTQRVGAASRTFDGTDDFFTVADANSLTFVNNTMTAEAWVKRSGLPAAQEYVIIKGVTTFEYALLVQTAGTVGGIIWTSAGTQIATATGTTVITDGNWHHIAFTSNGATFAVYVDGKLDASSNTFAGTMANTTSSLFFGDRSDVANSEFQGDIDEVRISSIARSADEIAAIAKRKPYSVFTSDYIDFTTPIASWNNLTWTENNVATGDGETATSSTGLVAAWYLNSTSGTTATNNAGAGTCGGTASNCDGTLTNFASTGSQDAAALSGWTSNDRKWGAGAVNFDGSNDFIDILNGSGLDIATNGSFSIEAWIKGTGNGKTIFIAQNDANHGLIYFTVGPTTLTGTNNKLVVYLKPDGVGAATAVFSGVTTINDDVWHHVALTAQTNGSNRDIVLYVDGKVDATGTWSSAAALTFSSGGLQDIIISAGGGGFTFLGTIDTVRYWSKALPYHELLSNYQAGALEIQTRVGADTSPNDGSWEDWKPTTSESIIDAIDNVVGWATPSASIWQTAKISTSSSTIAKVQGDQALKVSTGTTPLGTGQVALWHMDETSGSGAYISDQVKTSVSGAGTGDGADGDITVSSSKSLNAVTIASGRTYADGIAYKVAPETATTSGSVVKLYDTINGLVAGDEVLLINLRGTSADFADVGNYEFHTISSINATTKEVTFQGTIANSYDGTTPGNQKVALQRVPNYNNVTVASGGTITATAFDVWATGPSGAAGYRTGIVAFRASGTIDVQSGGSISASSLGYIGGAGTTAANGNQGSSYSGAGTGSQAANGGGGGGGLRESGLAANNAGGGGGGGYGAAGTTASGGGRGGNGGGTYGSASLTDLFHGSGGGSGGGIFDGSSPGVRGGRGGGIVYIAGTTLTVSGTIAANGEDGPDSGWGGGGGAAGGSVYITGGTLSVGSSLVTASAGAAGSGGMFGFGGAAGGVGRIYMSATDLTGTTSPAANTDTLQNGTPTGTTVVDGFASKGRRFNGTSDYIVVPDTTDLDYSGGTLTISLWVKPGSTQVASADIFSKHGTTANSGYTFEMNGTANSNSYYFSWGTGSGFQCTATQIILTPNVWQHVAFVKSGTGLTLYMNGNQVSTCTGASATIANTVDLLYFGRFANTSSRFWNGTMDEVMFASVAMTGQEIQELYRAGGGHRFAETLSSTDLSTKKNLPFYVAADRPGTYLQATVGESLLMNYETEDSNIRGFWHLEEGQPNGAVVKDSGSLANTLTPTNSVASTSGVLGNARAFDGTNDYLACTDANCGGTTKLDIGTGSWSVSAWVNTTKIPAQHVINKGSAAGQFTYQLFLANGGSPAFGLSNTGDTNFTEASASARVNDGFWHHLAGTYDGTTIKIYIDGVLQTSSTTTSGTKRTDSTSDLQIGARTDATVAYFKGFIDEPFVYAGALTADQVRQMAEVKDRTFPITIDFAANLESSNLVTSAIDLTFDIDGIDYGAANKGDNLFWNDKIILKENVDGTEYIAQGSVARVTPSSGAVVVSSWDSGSTFPPNGFSVNATVFKWERQYWNIMKPLDTQIDAVTRLTFQLTAGGEGRTIYVDDLRSATDYLTTPGGSTITSSTGYRFLQYRVVNSLIDYNVTPALSSLTLDYSLKGAPSTPTLDSPADAATNQSLTPQLKTTATDSDSDYIRYKLELCSNVGMTAGCHTYDQTQSQTGWSGQDAETSTAYASGTQATFTVPSGTLSANSTYYWRTYAIDPGGTNTWSGTQGTPRSFSTYQTANPPSCTVDKGDNNTSIIPQWTDIYSAETDFTLEKNTDNGGFTSLTSPAANATSYTDNSVSSGHTYQYRIKANLGSNSTEWCTTSQISLQTGFFNLD